MPAEVRNPAGHWVRFGTTLSPAIPGDGIGTASPTSAFSIQANTTQNNTAAVKFFENVNTTDHQNPEIWIYGWDTFNNEVGIAKIRMDNYKNLTFLGMNKVYYLAGQKVNDNLPFSFGTSNDMSMGYQTGVNGFVFTGSSTVWGNVRTVFYPVTGNWDFGAGDLTTTGRISSGTATISAAGPTDNVDASGINTLFIDCSSNAVTIGGFTGGVSGQVLHIARLCATGNAATLEHNEGTAYQNIFLHAGADEVLTGEYGGWNLVCNGTSWFDVSHAKHV